MTRFPILIYAAGMGTRMAHLTQDRPKPMVPVAGKPLIDHALALVHASGVTGVCVMNLHYMGDQLRHHLSDQDVTFSDESDLLRETGGGLRHAMPLLGGSPVMTLNSDAVWSGPNPLQILADAWDDTMQALLLTVPRSQALGHSGQGDFLIGPDGKLTRGPDEVYTGVQIVRTDALAGIKGDVFSTNVLWDKIAQDGGLHGISYSGRWCDVGQPSSIIVAEHMLQEHADV